MQYVQPALIPPAKPRAGTQAAHRLSATSSLQTALHAFHTHMIEQDLSIHTIKAFDSDLRLLARFVGRGRSIGTIGASDLKGFLTYLRHERGIPCNPKSLARRLTTLKVFFAWLAEDGAIASDPAAPLVHQRVTTPLPQPLSDQEVEQLCASTDEWRRNAEQPDARPHLLVALLLHTGIKKGECMNITLADIHTSDPTSPSVRIRYEGVKQRYKERTLRLPAEFPAVLKEYLAQYEPRSGLFECTARNLEYVLDACGKRAGLPERRLSFETLRWTCAVRHFKRGMDEDTLRRKLGLSRITWAETLEKLKALTSPPL